VAGSFQSDNVLLGFIKGGEFLDQLSDYRLPSMALIG
jgi:hypothetical protein